MKIKGLDISAIFKNNEAGDIVGVDVTGEVTHKERDNSFLKEHLIKAVKKDIIPKASKKRGNL